MHAAKLEAALASPALVPQATRMFSRMLTLRRDAYQLWDEIDGRRRETDASGRVAAGHTR